ncbi:hypothetical protein DYB37_004348 [Aphanomyces astaci]|uniref:Uncharacterized protein n=1 Tax=Aphanomyces astaci TaxID=112090 RepID=A0A3R7E493_APHAT|nr:hypothetical protein DYB35_008007 [Aphanomyces astaci]RHZ08340.1 hypothetical protein DYB37_004348 [Aphanomyces astaci]
MAQPKAEYVHKYGDDPMTTLEYLFPCREVSCDQVLNEVLSANEEPDDSELTLLKPYESQYMAFMNAVNRFRVRLCFSIGAASCGLLYWQEAFVLNAFETPDPRGTAALYGLSFGLIVPTFTFGVLMTFVPWGRTRLERYPRCIQQAKGPIYPLVILLIPLFNVTRMRFAYSAVVGVFIVVVFFVVQLAAGPDATSSIVFTTLNYSMSVIGGMVSSYQKELLKRRNFTLGLNFSGTDDDASSRIHNPYYAKEVVCYRWTQAFRHADLERRFYRYWYLLDGNPYENPNAGILHADIYLSWRFAVAGMCLNQVVLVLQDVINLYKTPTHFVALGFRVGCIVPAYMILFGCMYYFCRAYAKGWMVSRVVASSSKRQMSVRDDLVGVHHGYTHTMQAITAVVILFHVYLTVNIGVMSVYFMGFLNATLVAHRSSFRLRFMYSSMLTMVACLAFLFGTRNVLSRQTHLEYMCYLGVVQILGMIVSYEEENLRRSFFIKKSLRALEFKAWLASLTRVQSWVRARMVRKANDARHRLKPPPLVPPASIIVANGHDVARRTGSTRVTPLAKFSLTVPLADIDINKNLRDLQGKLADIDINKNLRDLQGKLADVDINKNLRDLQGKLADVDLNKNLRDLQGRLNKNNEVVTSASSRMSKAGRFGLYSTCVSVLIAFGQVMFFLAKQKAVTWQAALNEIYDANHDKHDDTLTFTSTSFVSKQHNLHKRVFVQKQFELCMASVKMDPNLLFFEACAYYFYYEVRFLDAYRIAGSDDDGDIHNGISGPSELVLYWLSFGLIVPTFGLGVVATFVPWGRRRLERYPRCVQQAKGPIYALVILLIPLFNVTRMRFAYSAVVGWAIVVTYSVVEIAAGPDTASKTVFTTLNYSMSVVAGMVSSYQKVAPHSMHSMAMTTTNFIALFTTGVCLNQGVLLLQDVTNLYGTPTQLVALTCRLGCVIPAYMCLFASMYYLSRTYTTKWVESGRIKASPTLCMRTAHQARHSRRQPPSVFGVVRKRVKAATTSVAKAAQRRILNMRAGYTHTMQFITFVVVFIHIGLLGTGTLVYVIALQFGRRDIYSVYFQGLLNATMLAHRSSFRLRFVLSASVTVLTCLIFLLAAQTVLPRRVHLEYSAYLCVVQMLGMIVSYEEENLRRSFFIKKSLRALEFRANFRVRVCVSAWIRSRMLQLAIRAKSGSQDVGRGDSSEHNRETQGTTTIPTTDVLADKKLRDLQTRLNRKHVVITNIRPRFSQASKYAVYTTCGNLCVALCQAIYYLVAEK